MTGDRINKKLVARCINRSPYTRLLADKPAQCINYRKDNKIIFN